MQFSEKFRIRFRKLVLTDASQLLEIYSDKEAMRFRGSKTMNSLKDAENFVNNQNHLFDQMRTLRVGVELIADNTLIGTAMVRQDLRKSGEREIGYSIGRKYWRKGLGSEVVDMLLHDLSAATEVKSLIAWSHKENLASVRILEKNGFSEIQQDEYPNRGLYRRDI